MWFSARQLEDFDTITIGQADDLKWEGVANDGTPMRLWLSRCGTADGEPYERTVTVELYCVPDDEEDEQWHNVARYDGAPLDDRLPWSHCVHCGRTQTQPDDPRGELCDEHYAELMVGS